MYVRLSCGLFCDDVGLLSREWTFVGLKKGVFKKMVKKKSVSKDVSWGDQVTDRGVLVMDG